MINSIPVIPAGHSFPTRRSSDLQRVIAGRETQVGVAEPEQDGVIVAGERDVVVDARDQQRVVRFRQHKRMLPSLQLRQYLLPVDAHGSVIVRDRSSLLVLRYSDP